MYTRVFRSRSNFSRNTIKGEREGDGAERIDPRKQNKTRSPFFFYYNGWCNVTHAYTSTRVRRVASDHFRDRSTASSSFSSPILFPSVFFLFSFRTREKTRLGKISRIHFTRTAERRLVILFRMWFLRNWKPRHKCFPSVSRFRFLFFPAYFLIPSSRNSSAPRIEEWAIIESELLFFFSLSKNYSTICSIVA